MKYSRNQINAAIKFANRKYKSPIIAEVDGFIVLAQSLHDYENKKVVIERGNTKGFYRVEILLKRRLKEIETESNKIDKIITKKDKKWDWDGSKSYEEYREYMHNERHQLGELNREERLIMPYKLTELSEYGDEMPLREFIGAVQGSLFLDSDGFGRYVKDGKETDVDIYPSDVKHNSIRFEFDKMVWFNK